MSFYPERQVMCVPMSFETGEQLTVSITFPSKVQIHKVRSIVTKALAGTDAGTVAIKNNGGTTLDTLSHAASAALENADASEFANDVFVAAGETLKLTSAKTTAGGKVHCFIEYQPVSK